METDKGLTGLGPNSIITKAMEKVCKEKAKKHVEKLFNGDKPKWDFDFFEIRKIIATEIEKGVRKANEELGTNYVFDESSLSIKDLKV